MMEKDSKIYIAGHTGLVGSAVKRELENQGYINLVFRKSKELNLIDKKPTDEFFEQEKPEYVFIAAAKVGGIKANIENPAEFIYDNIQIQNNLIGAARKSGVKKLLFLGSNCVYPGECEQPMKEEHMMTGKFEPTNEPYAIAKIAGIGVCQAFNKQHGTNFISVIPASQFGPNDNYDAENSHLVPALIGKFHEAKKNKDKEVVLWGTGEPRREIMYVDDLAKALIFLINNYDSSEIINIGVGKDFSVREIAEMVKEIVGFEGEVVFDSSKPDGMMRKLLDNNKINSLGWKSEIDIIDGLKKTYDWFVKNPSS